MSATRAASFPPPVGGWNTLEALADMKPDHAVTLDNWFPDADRVSVRRGYVAWATGLPGAVETLMPYQPPSGTARIFAAAGAGIYDATAGGAIGAAVVSGLSNAQFQWAQMTTAGGHFLFACNGDDTPQVWDGSAWVDTTITGPTVANIAWVNIHQRRMWVGEADSLRGWYLGPNAIGGAADFFDFTGLASLGGFIIGMGTWTRDGGSGPDDLAVFLTSEGEALIYAGNDPASNWALVGIFRLGRPLGRRCMIRAGAELMIMTDLGFVSLSDVLPVDRSQQSAAAFSRQINPTVVSQARAYFTNFGWQAFIYPAGNMAIFNVPNFGAPQQYVFNTLTRAPCRFTGVPALCWGLLGSSAYFGASGVVYLFDTGLTDAGTAVDALAVQAFNPFGSAAQKKAFKRVQAILVADDAPAFAVDMVTDYQTNAPLPALASPAFTAARYDEARYDEAVYGGEQVFDGSRGVRGIGRVGAVRLRHCSMQARPSWLATNVQFIPGGTL